MELSTLHTRILLLNDMCETDEYISELADKGEVVDINDANFKNVPHKRLIYKVSVWGT